MSLSGKSTTSLRKTDLLSQKEPALSFKKLVFAHKATAGDTSINLSSLSLPSELVDFVQPNLSELQALTVAQLKKNLRLQSSARGTLMYGLSYTLGGNGSINFTDSFGEALDGEIFIGTLDSIPRTGTLVADVDYICETGTLAANTTDISVGKSFKVNLNPSKQLGAVMVMIEGQPLLRNLGNATAAPSADGNYEEVDSGNGYSTLIRLNESSPSARAYMVVSTVAAAIRPDGSVLDELEALQATMDTVVETVAELAGVPETNFQAAPTQVQLKQFGDRVVDLEIKNKIQTKVDTTTRTSSAANIIVFNNLVVGQVYRIFVKCKPRRGTTGAGNRARLLLKHNSVTIMEVGIPTSDGVGSNNDYAGLCGSFTFVAAATTVNIDADISGTGSQLFGSTSLAEPDGTMATLEWLKNYEVTTDFT